MTQSKGVVEIAWTWKPNRLWHLGPFALGWAHYRAGKETAWQLELRWRGQTWIHGSRSSRATVLWFDRIRRSPR